MVTWDHVTRADVLRAIEDYDRLGPERFFSKHGFAPTTTYELAWEGRRYPPKQSWAQPMSSQRASGLAPVTSRAGRQVP
jgi:hypothetical protein